MLRRFALLIAPLAASVTLASAALAQRDGMTLSGTVRDAQGKPITLADVLVSGTELRARTSESGAFRFESVPAGKRWVVVRRLGYEPVAHALTLERGKNRDVAVTLDQLPQSLPATVVEARSGYTDRYGDFYRRSRSAWGNFITRDDIERENPPQLGWMVQRYLPFYDSRSMDEPAFFGQDFGSFATARGFSRFGSSLGRVCPPAVSVDGKPSFGGWAVNDFRPDEVEAVEVYRAGIARIPIEFERYPGTSCGLVIIWTR